MTHKRERDNIYREKEQIRREHTHIRSKEATAVRE